MSSSPVGVALVALVSAIAGNAHADEAHFRERNPGRWTAVEFDVHGQLRRMRTDDPSIVGTGTSWTDDDIIRLRGILQINRDDLGGTADEREPERIGNSALGFMLFDDSTSLVTGFVELRRTGKALDIRVAHLTLDTDAAASLLAGKRRVQSVTLGRPARLDCAMAPGGARNCRAQVVRALHREVRLAADEVHAMLSLRAVGGAIHLTACIDAEHPVPEAATDDGLEVLDNRLAGVPFVVDAVTRKRLPIRPARCEH